MKKFLYLFVLSLSCLGFSVSVSADEVASSADPELTVADKAIVDSYIDQNLDRILETAKVSSNYVEGHATLSSDDGTVYNLPSYIVDTTQVTRQLTNNENIKSQVVIVDTADANESTRAAGSKNGSLWDNTGSVQASSTIYYDEQMDGSGRKYKLTSVSGRYSIGQSGVSVSNQNVTYGCSDTVNGTQRGVRNPTGSSYSYSTGFSRYATTRNIGFVVGVNHSMRISRGSSWNFTHYNQL